MAVRYVRKPKGPKIEVIEPVTETLSARDQDIAELLVLPEPDRSKVRDSHTFHEVVHSGIPGAALTQLSGALDLTTSDFAGVLGVGGRTYFDMVKRARIDPLPSDRAYRLASILAGATEVFGTRERARAWMKEPLPALGGATPLQRLATEAGAERVRDVLAAVEHGVYV